MAQICTTRWQGKKLQKLGISIDTADMSWHFVEHEYDDIQWELKQSTIAKKRGLCNKLGKMNPPLYEHEDGSPMTGDEIFNGIWGNDFLAWSLGALIGLMPEEIRYFGTIYCLTINKNRVTYTDDQGNSVGLVCYGDLFCCCVDIIEWLVSNGYINNK